MPIGTARGPTFSCINCLSIRNGELKKISHLPLTAINNDMEPYGDAKPTDMNNLDLLEKQMIAKNQAERDIKRIKNVVLGYDKMSAEKSTEEEGPPSTLSIAVAAGSAVGLVSLAALHIPVLSLGAFAATTYVANRDPIKDEDLMEGDLSGPLSRIIGRATLTTIEKTTPAVQTVLRSILDDGNQNYNKKETQLDVDRMQETSSWNQGLNNNRQRLNYSQNQYSKFTIAELDEIAKKGGTHLGGSDLMPSIPISMSSSDNAKKRKYNLKIHSFNEFRTREKE